MQHLTMLTELDLSYNAIENLDSWHTKLGNVKQLHLAGNKISSLNGLHKLYSLEFLDVRDNNVSSPEDIKSVGSLPCLDHLILRGNPIRHVIEYRTKVLEHFGERAVEVCLSSSMKDFCLN
ncbi:unnamed protein product [Gongylonema pulchrum]|uniref:Leucine Rich repeat-containing domain protein n=1 Tax=Gongylonema pulchrum TaxID=637853 RepID=A0A183EWF9_9BILA|nr:unnamed protein product [Gongylonema pulchrum]